MHLSSQSRLLVEGLLVRLERDSLSSGGGGRSSLLSGLLSATVGSSSSLLLGGLGEGLVSLVGAVDSHLDGNLSPINILAVHLLHGLLLQLLRSKGHEAKAAALALLAAGLKLLDHESGNGSQGDLSRERLVGSEELLQLLGGSVKVELELWNSCECEHRTDLLFG